MILVRASTAGRCKDIARIARLSIKVFKTHIEFQLLGWKTDTKGQKEALSRPIIIEFMENQSICAATTLLQYVERNKNLYESSHSKLHDLVWIKYNTGEAVKHTTLAKDTREVMKECGIDTKLYGAATIRHAAISYWCSMGLSREEVARRTGHRSMNVISFYYDKSTAKDLMKEREEELVDRMEVIREDNEESEEEDEYVGAGNDCEPASIIKNGTTCTVSGMEIMDAESRGEEGRK
jgi:hypothetical protein